jgi:predicted amidohydrolase
MRVAAVQGKADLDPDANLRKARGLIARAAEQGAGMVILPELFMSWGRDSSGEPRPQAQPLDGPFVRGLAEAAKDAGVWVIAGAVEATPEGDSRVYNTTVILDAAGALAGSYRKTHLFDAFGNQESRTFAPGDAIFSPISTPLGCTGLLVCYELRFPEVARRQVEGGAQVLIVPSAWVAGAMKELHWQTLVKARAIENTAYVIAADQVGNEFLGRSLIVDPMGVVLAEGSETEDIITAEIDLERVRIVRERVPSLRHRRPEMY